MGTTEIVVLFEGLTVLAAALAIWATLRSVRAQMWVQIFSDYTSRFASLQRDLAEHRNADRQVDAAALAPLFNLWSEEHYLWDRNKIDKDLWNHWRSGMEAMLMEEEIRDAWTELRQRYADQRVFQDLIDGCLGKRA